MTAIEDLETPRLLLDRRRLTRNIERMLGRVERRGLALRPHLKTAKNVEIARMATRDRRYGVTVSTLKEAEHFADHGFTDVVELEGHMKAWNEAGLPLE